MTPLGEFFATVAFVGTEELPLDECGLPVVTYDDDDDLGFPIAGEALAAS